MRYFKMVLLYLLVIISLTTGCNFSKNRGDDPITARVAARHIAEKRIQQPSLNFPSYNPSFIFYLGENRYSVNAYVDSKNILGGPARRRFRGEFRCIERGWELLSLQLC